MTSTTAGTVPDHIFHHSAYGLDITWLGDGCEVIAARGHVPARRFAAAASSLGRTVTLRNPPCGALLSGARHAWGVFTESPESPDGWTVGWAGITEQTPGAFPLTVWEPPGRERTGSRETGVRNG